MEWSELDVVQEFTVEGQCSKIKVRSCRMIWDSLQVPGVELTLSELQEMATRQQQQIEAQQQMLVAKEQRWRYLQQGGRAPQGQSQSEAEKLQRLKEHVESQEAKLKRIRAMRGQVDYSHLLNGTLSAEIDHVSSLFQEKQAELQTAVLRVDQLTQQLEDLRRGRLQLQPTKQAPPTGQQATPPGHQGMSLSGPAALELRKLYQELQARNRQNLDQTSLLSQNNELLSKRNGQLTLMDKHIGDLRERLTKKRAELSLTDGVPLPSPQPSSSVSGRVAAVCPYIQVPMTSDPALKAPPTSHTRSHSEEGSGLRKPPSQWKVSDLDIVPLEPAEKGEGPQSPQGGYSNTAESSWPVLSKSVSSLQQSEWRTPSAEQLPPGYGTYPSATHQPAGHHCATSSLPCSAPGTLGWHRPGATNTSSSPTSSPSSSSSQQMQQRISVPPTSAQSSYGSTPSSQPSPLPAPPQADRADPPPRVAVQPYVPDRPSRPQSPRKGPVTVNSSSIYSMYLQQPQAKNYSSLQPQAKNYNSLQPQLKKYSSLQSQVKNYNSLQSQLKNYSSLTNKTAVKAVYGKPVLPSSSSFPSPVPFQQGRAGGRKEGTERELIGGGGGRGGGAGVVGQPFPAPPSVDSIPRPLSPTKLTPVAHSPLRYQNDADLEVLRRRLSNAPRPLKKRSSITEPEGPQGPNIQKLLYQRFNSLAGSMEEGTGSLFYQPGCLLDMDNIHSANGNIEPGERPVGIATTEVIEDPNLTSDPQRTSPPSVTVEIINESTETVAASDASPSPQHSPPPNSDRLEDQNNNQQGSSPTHSPIGHASPSPPLLSPSPTAPAPPKVKRSNLKKPWSDRTGQGLRVKFNPLSLLLDASLEGEFHLVQRIIYEVENPSTANDEGITPLHNAVCAGHHHIVKFLLDFGVNVNAADSDGWTPLHCAASCNSVHLCKLLVESGAAIFASTISDVETAADKCEEMEDGYTQCSQFLYGVQEKLGVMNKGSVFALWDYSSQHADELSFNEGDALTVLRRHNDAETEWWWAELHGKEGYVPRNLLGLYPRIKPRQRSLA